MSSKSNKSKNNIIEELKLALKKSRNLYGRNNIPEAKQIALDAKKKALAAGLNLDAKVLEAQALICDKRWDEVVALLSAAVQKDFHMLGFALDRLGFAYANKMDYDKAIEFYQKALDTPGYDTPGDALNNMGIAAYNDEKDSDKAIEYYQKALDTPGYDTPGMALNNMGNAYGDKKDYNKAIEYYQKALDTPGYETPGNALYNMGIVYAQKKDYDQAIELMRKAIQEYEKTNDDSSIENAKELMALWQSTERAVKKGLPEIAKEYADVASALAEPSKPVADVEDPYRKRLIKRAGARTTAFEEYANHRPSESNDVLVVLKGWSSAIPIIAEMKYEGFGGQTCRGGGYFIKAANHGIALDPGYDYLRNLWANKYHIKEINTVIVTHNHPDHQDDLCRIAGLDYEYRKNVSGSPKKSAIRYYLDQDTERAYEPTLKALNANSKLIKQVDVDNQECHIPPDMCLEVFKTRHGDGNIVSSPFGGVLRLKLQDGSERRIGYTSDTAYFKELPEHLKDCDVLICHFSSAQADEFGDPEKLHPFHLGFNGLKKLIQNTNAKLYIISEFWGGVGDQRYDLVEYLKYENKSRKREVNIVAGDIGLTIDLKTLGIYCSSCGKPWPFDEVRTIEPSCPFDGIRYFCRNCPTLWPMTGVRRPK
jgi:tetratricopeptide (TPR) repeat protein